MSDLYDTDLALWSEQQAALLRRLASGERVNDQVDWENVVEEIEDVGGRERDKVTEALVQALCHKLCLIGWPHSTAVRHWEAEVRIHLATARRRFRNSMRQYITPESWQDDYQSALLETASHMADEWPPPVALPSEPGRWTNCSPRARPRDAGSHERPYRSEWRLLTVVLPARPRWLCTPGDVRVVLSEEAKCPKT
jgi:hypothetical protein